MLMSEIQRVRMHCCALCSPMVVVYGYDHKVGLTIFDVQSGRSLEYVLEIPPTTKQERPSPETAQLPVSPSTVAA